MENLVDGDPTTIAITDAFSWLRIEKYSSMNSRGPEGVRLPHPPSVDL